MTKKYGVLDPSTGGYAFFIEKADALSNAAEVAFNFYLAHTHSNFLVNVDTDENGVETWTGSNGESMMSPAELEIQAQWMRNQVLSFMQASKMEVTKL